MDDDFIRKNERQIHVCRDRVIDKSNSVKVSR